MALRCRRVGAVHSIKSGHSAMYAQAGLPPKSRHSARSGCASYEDSDPQRSPSTGMITKEVGISDVRTDSVFFLFGPPVPVKKSSEKSIMTVWAERAPLPAAMLFASERTREAEAAAGAELSPLQACAWLLKKSFRNSAEIRTRDRSRLEDPRLFDTPAFICRA
jgi:hypothetical protein